MDLVYLFLDANILLHYLPPDQIDWCQLCKAENVNIVVYPVLMTEISNAKDMHSQKHIRARARQRESWLDSCLENLGQPVRRGTFLFRDGSEPLSLLSELGLDRQIRDDIIVAQAVNYSRQDRPVVVCTADGGLRMKLEQRGISVLRLPDDLRLAGEADPERQRADAAERELRELRNRMPDLQIVCPAPVQVTRQAGFGDVEDYVSNALTKVDAIYKARQVTRLGYPTVSGGDSIHNPRHRDELQRATMFLRDQHRWMSTVQGATSVKLVVANRGNLTATKVRARVYLPEHLTIYGRGGFGVKPTPLMLSTIFAGLPIEPLGHQMDVHFIAAQLEGDAHVSRADGLAEFFWGTVLHDSKVASSPFWITVGHGSSLGKTALHVELLCEEYGKIYESYLPIEVIDGSPQN